MVILVHSMDAKAILSGLQDSVALKRTYTGACIVLITLRTDFS